MVRVVRLVHQIYLFLCLSPLSVFFFYWNCNGHKKQEFLWCSTVAYAEMTRTCLIEDSIEKENWFSDFRATLKAGNRNPEPETRIWNPESTNHRQQFLQICKIYFAQLLSVKNKRLWARNVTCGTIGKSHDNKRNFVARLKRQSHHNDWCKQISQR